MKQNCVSPYHNKKIKVCLTVLLAVILSVAFLIPDTLAAEWGNSVRGTTYQLFFTRPDENSLSNNDIMNTKFGIQLNLESNLPVDKTGVRTYRADRVNISMTQKYEVGEKDNKRKYELYYLLSTTDPNTLSERITRGMSNGSDFISAFTQCIPVGGASPESGFKELFETNTTPMKYLYICVRENYKEQVYDGEDEETVPDDSVSVEKNNYYIEYYPFTPTDSIAGNIVTSLKKHINQDTNTNTVDVGDMIELSIKKDVEVVEEPADEMNEPEEETKPFHRILYSTDKSHRPQLTKVESDEYSIRDILDNAAYAQSGMYSDHPSDYICCLQNFNINNDIHNYIRVNNIWYSFDPEVKVCYEGEKILIDESIRSTGRLSVYAMAVQSGKDVGQYQTSVFTYAMDETVKTPEASIPTGDKVIMGQKITVTSESGAKLFYTTNGSTPSIKMQGKTPVAGNATTLPYDENITISQSFASYGRSTAIMVQAVLYDTNGYRIKKDSEVAVFRYEVDNQAVVNNVTCTPDTSSEEPTQVKEGDIIQLAYSNSVSANSVKATIPDNISIYYTTDGTQPSMKDGVPSGSTQKYDIAKGIVVPKAKDTFFTITAFAVLDNTTFGNISHFVFKYPPAISSPYATPAQGTVTNGTEVILKSSSNGVIYYEVAYDGKNPVKPSTDSPIFSESAPIVITRQTKIKAFAVSNGVKSSVASFHYQVADKLAVPSASIESGSIIPSGSKVTLTSNEGATIYYTLDGSNPMAEDNAARAIGSDILIDGSSAQSITLRAYAVKEGFSDSEQAVFTYTISSYGGGIFPDKEDGSILRNGEKVTLNTDVSGATIYYTTDGSIPTSASASGSVVTITGQAGDKVILKAIAMAAGSTRTTAAATFSYQIMNKLKEPGSSVASGALFTGEGKVTLSAEEGDIHYTTDGSVPTAGSPKYVDGIVINREIVIKAIAVAEGSDNSDVSEFHYAMAQQVEQPVVTIPSGEVEIGTSIQFTCATEGAIMYYTNNGTAPDLKDKDNLNIYNGAIMIDRAMNIQVIAVKEHMQNSKVLTVGYTVKEQISKVMEDDDPSNVEQPAGNRLQSRNSFQNQDAGPKYMDVILKDKMFGSIISAPKGNIPEDAVLVVEKVQVADATRTLIKQLLQDSYSVVTSYDVRLIQNEQPVEPSGTIEIGMQIPYECENAIISIVSVGDDGMVQTYETRRSAGVAYAEVDHMGVYSIVAPTDFETKDKKNNVMGILLITGIGGLGLISYLFFRNKTKGRKIEDAES